MKAKKQYTKPQLTQVGLAIQNPVLASCNSVNPDIATGTLCNRIGSLCADATP
jgi:hypothetical protein